MAEFSFAFQVSFDAVALVSEMECLNIQGAMTEKNCDVMAETGDIV